MARRGDGDPLWVEPMKVTRELFLLGERHRPLKLSAMNLRLPKWTVSLREKPLHVKQSPSVEASSADEGTIGRSRGKARCKSLFLVRQLLVFFAPTRYRVVKIVCSSSDVILQIMKHTMIYPGSAPSSEVIALRPVV
jgi:hypothetical protein